MDETRHVAEKALLPLPLAEDTDPQVLTAYGALLRSRKTITRPVVRYNLYCNTLDLAIATQSDEQADEAYAGLTSLANRHRFDLADRPFTYVRIALAYQPSTTYRIRRQEVPKAVKVDIYRNLAVVMRDVLAYPGMAHDTESNYIGEGLILGALLRAKKGPFPYFSVDREENNACHSAGNHDFFTRKNNRGEKQPWQVKMSSDTDLPSIYPVRDIFVMPLLAHAFNAQRKLKSEAEAGATGLQRLRAQRNYMANLMVRESLEDDLPPAGNELLNGFTRLVADHLRTSGSSHTSQGDYTQDTIGARFGDAFRKAGLIE